MGLVLNLGYENQHKVTQFFFMLKLPYTKIDVGLLETTPKYEIECHSLFGVAQCYIFLLLM